MKRRRLLGPLLSTAILAGIALGSMNAAAEEVKTLHVAWTADMQTMDVHKTSSNYCIPLCIFDRLF